MNALAYVYDSNERHGKPLKFENTPKNIANFIIYYENNRVVIKDEFNQFIASSVVGGFLDRVVSPDLRVKILEEMLPLRFGYKLPFNPVK